MTAKTKKVVLRVQISGSRPGPKGNAVDWPAPGETLECSAQEADDLVRQKIAFVKGEEVETAVDPSAVETAVAPKAGNKPVNPRGALTKTADKEES
jgi:hypothetical protein